MTMRAGYQIFFNSTRIVDSITGFSSFKEVPERWPLKERSRENSGSLYAPSELYDARTEDLFSFLQILSASVSGKFPLSLHL